MTEITDPRLEVESSETEDVPRRGMDLRSLLLWIFLFILLAACLGMVWVSLRRTAETVRPVGSQSGAITQPATGGSAPQSGR